MEKSPNANMKRKKEIKMDEILQTDVFFFCFVMLQFLLQFLGTFFPFALSAILTLGYLYLT
jgi:hypothetical protein